MTKKKTVAQPEPAITEHPEFYKMIEHAIAISDEILCECGEDDETLQNSAVTVSADFILDMTDIIVEFACRYEDFDPSEIIGLLELQRLHQVRYGTATVH